MSPPAWLTRPAVGRITVSAPALWRPFQKAGRAYRESVKPFGFALSAHVAPLGHPPGADATRFHLLAPYERAPGRWLQLPWIEMYSGQPYALTTGLTTSPQLVRVKTFRDVMEFYETHPEPKSADADGLECDRGSVGLLQRRLVHATGVVYIGKESHRVEEVEQGLVHDWAEIIEPIGPPQTRGAPRVEWTAGAPSPREVAAAAGLTERYLRMVRNGQRQPSAVAQRRIQEAKSRLGAR